MTEPVCGTCGAPMRWYAEYAGWGCDRCRQFHPAARPRPMGLYLALGGGAALLAITIIVLAATSGESEGGGHRSRGGRSSSTGGATYGFHGDSIEDVVAGLEAYRDRMCDCKRAGCADKVDRDYKEWKRQVERKISEKELDDPRTARKFDRLDAERKKCRDEARAGDTSDFIDMYERFADRACLCTTQACATRVSEEMTRDMTEWTKRNPGSSTAKPDYDSTKRMEQIAKRLTDCLMKAQSTANTDPIP